LKCEEKLGRIAQQLSEDCPSERCQKLLHKLEDLHSAFSNLEDDYYGYWVDCGLKCRVTLKNCSQTVLRGSQMELMSVSVPKLEIMLLN